MSVEHYTENNFKKEDEIYGEDLKEFIRRGYFGYLMWHRQTYGEDPSRAKIRELRKAAHSTWRFPRYRIIQALGRLLR